MLNFRKIESSQNLKKAYLHRTIRRVNNDFGGTPTNKISSRY